MFDYQRVALLKIQELHNLLALQSAREIQRRPCFFFCVGGSVLDTDLATGKDLFEARNDFPGKTNKPSKPKWLG